MKQASWLVFAPPAGRGEDELEKTRFVRDGFSLWPLIFGPFWFLAKRLWLGALVSALLLAAGLAARILLGIRDPLGGLVTLLPALLLALEASTFERRKLLRAGWREVDVVRAPNAVEAETRAIARLAEALDAPAISPPRPATAPIGPQAGGFPAVAPVLGVFPEAAGRR